MKSIYQNPVQRGFHDSHKLTVIIRSQITNSTNDLLDYNLILDLYNYYRGHSPLDKTLTVSIKLIQDEVLAAILATVRNINE